MRRRPLAWTVALLFVSPLFVLAGPNVPHALADYPESVCGSFGSGTGHQLMDKHVYEYTHNGHLVAVAFCVMKTSELDQDYFWARLRFDDPSLPNQSGEGKAIEVEYLRLNDQVSESDDPDASCDQTNNWTDPIGPDGQSNDGRGCNRGNYSGAGPCQGFKSMTQSPFAYGSHGCQTQDGEGDTRYTTFAQTDKVNGRETDSDTCDATVEFRIKWADGSVSSWKDLSRTANC
jgi:hypothetical protein